MFRACHNDFPKTTRVRAAAILHRLCVSVPAASIGLGRVMPELLLLHLEADRALVYMIYLLCGVFCVKRIIVYIDYVL